MTNDLRDYLRQGLPVTSGPLNLDGAMRRAKARRRRTRLAVAAVPTMLAAGLVGVMTGGLAASDRLTGTVAATPTQEQANPTPPVEDLWELVQEMMPPGYSAGERSETGNAEVIVFTSLAPPRNLSPEAAAEQEARTSARLARERGQSPPSQEQPIDALISDEVRQEAARLLEEHRAAEAVAPTTIQVFIGVLPPGEPGWTHDILKMMSADIAQDGLWGPTALVGVLDRQPSYYQLLLQQEAVSLNVTVGQPTNPAIADARQMSSAVLARLR